MGVWTEDEFVSRAKTLAMAYVGTKTPLNDLVEKVAREAELTPDAIRTLGRLTNVAVFQEVFQQKAASSDADRMVEFEPGDPEVVISRVVKSAEIQIAPSTQKVAYEIPDFMRAERGFSDEQEKTASAPEPEERRASRPLEVMRLRKMAAELDIAVKTAALRWEDGVQQLATRLRKAPGYGPSYHDFEKSALAEFGLRASVELVSLREDLRLPKQTFSHEKVAALLDRYASTDTAELHALERVIDAREQYEVLRAAQAQVGRRLSND